MADWAAWMRHPDGGTAHFNDGAIVPAEAVDGFLRSGERIGARAVAQTPRGGKHLAATGFAVWRGDPWSVFFDVGRIGPDEQPGHAHADTLAIECSFENRRLIVDPGTFGYDDDERRRYDRGTPAHNTVAIDGQDSSEMWHVFRVGRRARPREVSVAPAAEGLEAGASHDGFDHLPGRPRHRRTLRLRDRGCLRVEDEVSGSGSHRLAGGFLIEPAWDVRPAPDGWLARAGDHRVRVRLELSGAAQPLLERRWHHPDYGVEREATWIGWRWSGDLPFRANWVLHDDLDRGDGNE
jgi:uncharacterized heparinase superfamily protein